MPGMMRRIVQILFNRENFYALLLCLILLAVTVLTAEQAAQWIYQGF
jgi:hypothetical protein